MNLVIPRLRRFITPLSLLALALVTTLNAWRIMVHFADLWGFLVDELIFTQAAVNFFRSLDYTSAMYFNSARFAPAVSNGLAATWPSAIAWMFHGNMLASRLILGGAIWSFFWLVGWQFWRGRGLSTSLGVFCLASLWSLVLWVIPNAPLLLINMGELVGALWVGLGAWLMRRSPALAALCWGIAVWHCKVIYLAPAAGLGAAWFITSPGRWATRLRQAAVSLACFFVPLLLWLALIWVRFDSATVGAWLQGYSRWLGGSLLNWTGQGTGGPPQTAQVSGLLARLNSPGLEWYYYALDWKIKILLLTAGAVVVSGILLFTKPRLAGDRLNWWSALAIAGSVGAFTAWYFLWHPDMYIRHIQPALYLGLGLYVFWLGRLALLLKGRLEEHARIGLSLALVFIGWQTIDAWRTPLLQPQATYARTCTDVFSPNCGDYTSLRDQIRQTPGSVVVRDGPPPSGYPVFEESYGRVNFTVPPDCAGQSEPAMAQQLGQIAATHPEIWLLRTMPLVCDTQGYVPRWLAEHAYPVEEFWLQDNLFTRYLMGDQLAIQETQGWRLGDSITLAAWAVDKKEVVAGQGLRVGLTWMSKTALPVDYRVFVFLANSSEQVAVLHDAVPTMWLRPTTTWQPGELITDHHGLLVPADAGPGDYWLGVGLYNSATGERLPVTAGEGWLNNSALKLTRVTILAPR